MKRALLHSLKRAHAGYPSAACCTTAMTSTGACKEVASQSLRAASLAGFAGRSLGHSHRGVQPCLALQLRPSLAQDSPSLSIGMSARLMTTEAAKSDKVKALDALSSYIGRALKFNGPLATEAELKTIALAVDSSIKWLRANHDAEADVIYGQLKELQSSCDRVLNRGSESGGGDKDGGASGCGGVDEDASGGGDGKVPDASGGGGGGGDKGREFLKNFIQELLKFMKDLFSSEVLHRYVMTISALLGLVIPIYYGQKVLASQAEEREERKKEAKQKEEKKKNGAWQVMPFQDGKMIKWVPVFHELDQKLYVPPPPSKEEVEFQELLRY